MPMQVPDHIYLDGDSTRTRGHSFTAPSTDSREILTVPDRITLAGNGGHIGMKATPGKDLIRDRIDSIAVHVNNFCRLCFQLKIYYNKMLFYRIVEMFRPSLLHRKCPFTRRLARDPPTRYK